MLGILNYVPYFGSIIGSIIAIIIVTFTQGLTPGIITAVVLLITQQIDGNIIQPKLMGGSFSMSPLLIIISVTVGGAFAGILGMIIAIPIVAVLKDALEDLINYREQQQQKQGLP
jgi:predicted PurR-regulated permease PerM